MTKVILIGWLCINIPITIVMLMGGYIAYSIGYNYRIGVLLSFLPCWTYWSFTIPLWRKWALKECNDEEKLEKYGQLFLLTFKKGSFLSKTEYKYKK
jgi:hypothetical protein